MIHFFKYSNKERVYACINEKKLEILCYVLQYLEKHTLLIYFNAKFRVSLVGPISKCGKFIWWSTYLYNTFKMIS